MSSEVVIIKVASPPPFQEWDDLYHCCFIGPAKEVVWKTHLKIADVGNFISSRCLKN